MDAHAWMELSQEQRACMGLREDIFADLLELKRLRKAVELQSMTILNPTKMVPLFERLTEVVAGQRELNKETTGLLRELVKAVTKK